MLTSIITSYAYDNVLPVQVVDDSTTKKRYKTVYARNLKLYKGIDNTIKFTVQNQEQKAYDLRTSTSLLSASIPEGGAGNGYTVGDILTISGGTATTAAQITVTSVTTVTPLGVITGFTITTPGLYTKPPYIVNNILAGGTGKGAALMLTLQAESVAAVQFNLLNDDNMSVLFSRQADIIDAAKGVVSVTLNEGDLGLVKTQYMSYSLALLNSPTSQYQALYVDDNFNARGQAQVLSGQYPEHRPSVQVTFVTSGSNTVTEVTEPYLTLLNNTYISSIIFTDANIKRSNTLHTIQILVNPNWEIFHGLFSGVVTIEASTDPMAVFNATSPTITWGTVDTLNLIDVGYSLTHNFEGVYTAIRIKVLPSYGTISGILYRS